MRKIDLFKGYEKTRLLGADEYAQTHASKTFFYDELPLHEIDGVPIISQRVGGRLRVTFASETHVLAIGATRSGKTTGFVIPTINILLKKKNKASMVISDPKGELYRRTSDKFVKEGYRVILLDFVDYTHSDCWNPLTRIYRDYRKYRTVHTEVKDLSPDGIEFRSEFKGVVYTDPVLLEENVRAEREIYYDRVEKAMGAIVAITIPRSEAKDPYWEESARDVMSAVLYGMLEDSDSGEITEQLFSFETMLRIMDSFSGNEKLNCDRGYFTSRSKESKAYQLAEKTILSQADSTRNCILSSCMTKMNKFRDTSIRKVTCTNTFEMSELDDRPTVIYVAYKDEESTHYDVISMLLTNLYTELIAIARTKGESLDRPFYFLLDEFGNLPPFGDFNNKISTCGSRNIWFLVILQSYAQLENVYGAKTAEIIKDNLNTHIFFGTNNPKTKMDFSVECGKTTVLSPQSVFSGKDENITNYIMDTIPAVPVSDLDTLEIGECIVTYMRSFPILSVMERSYLCPEFDGVIVNPADRGPQTDYLHNEYVFVPKPKRR